MRLYLFLFYVIIHVQLTAQDQIKGILYVLIDSDISATTYYNGKLDRITGHRDQLIRVELISNRRSVLNIPNSATAWTKTMAISNDRKSLIISSFRGSANPGITQVNSILDLPSLQNIYMVDAGTLEVVDEIKAGKLPWALSVHPNKNQLGVATNEKGKEIKFIDFSPGEFTKSTPFALDNYTSKLTDLNWHPSGEYFAITDEEMGTVGFGTAVEPEKLSFIASGNLPGAGRWTSDGNYYLVTDSNNWTEEGTLTLISPDFKKGKHTILSRLKTGKAPVAMAISQDNRYVVVSCMEGTFFTRDHTSYTDYSTLILFEIDDSGKLKELDRKKSNEILPRGLDFMPGSLRFALSSFQSARRSTDGFISFWEIKNKKLKKLENKIEVPRGPHTLLWTL